MYIFLRRLAENFFEERSRWFSWAVVLFGAGIAFYFSLSFEPSIWISLGIVEAILLAAWFCRFSNARLFVLAMLAIFTVGFVSIQLKAFWLNQTYHHFNNEKMYISGRVSDIEYNYRGMPRVTFEDVKNFDNEDIAGKIRVNLMSKKHEPKIGQCGEMVVVMYPPLKPVMVGGYQFNRKYFFEGISASAAAKSRVLEIDCATTGSFSNLFSNLIFSVRAFVVARINSVLPKDEAGIAAAIIAGERAGISQNLYNQYRDSGLAHFISISGLHMSMLAGLMFFLVRLVIALIPPLALRFDSKKIAAWLAIAMSGIYLLISGMEVPAQRAFIMTLIVLIGVLISRKAISMLTISWAALIVLMISPQALIGASFQMSFAAVMCLIAFYERYAASMHNFLNRGGFFRVVWLYVGGIVAADLVASLATLPFAIYHFNRIAIFTTLGNFLAGPVIGLLIMPFLLVSLLLMPFGLDWPALKLLGFGVKLVNDITLYVAGLPNAGYQVLSMPTYGLAFIVVGGLWLCIWQKPWRRFGFLGIVLGCLSMFLVNSPDVVVNENVFAVKDNFGNLVVMPARGTSFEKKVWLEETASKPLDKEQQKLLRKIYVGKATDRDWIDLECRKNKCTYKGVVLDKKNLGQARSIWLGKEEITVDQYIGNRYWSQ